MRTYIVYGANWVSPMSREETNNRLVNAAGDSTNRRHGTASGHGASGGEYGELQRGYNNLVRLSPSRSTVCT